MSETAGLLNQMTHVSYGLKSLLECAAIASREHDKHVTKSMGLLFKRKFQRLFAAGVKYSEILAKAARAARGASLENLAKYFERHCSNEFARPLVVKQYEQALMSLSFITQQQVLDASNTFETAVVSPLCYQRQTLLQICCRSAIFM